MSSAQSPSSVDRDALVDYLDTYLEADAGKDYCPNGLQIEGREAVSRVITAVSACAELFERAHAAAADAVLVHHGLFWEGTPRQLTGVAYRRVRAVLEAGFNLIAYHLPLDRHGEVGNNAVAARELSLVDLMPFGVHGGTNLGFAGCFEEAVSAADFVSRCRDLYQQEPLLLGSGPAEVRRVGIISGAAEREVHTALELGLDAFITGEATEWVMNLTREAGIHYLACGHYATERLGVRALGEHLAERFELEVEFIDIPNPV